MKCKDCPACVKGFFKLYPKNYVCTGAKEPFMVINIDQYCTEYPEKNKPDCWSWNAAACDEWMNGTFDTREEAIQDALKNIREIRYVQKRNMPTIILGKCEYIPLRTDVDVERVLEYLGEAYSDDSGCDYDIYEGVTDEQLEWLENKFSEVMNEFHKMAKINPGWFEVIETEEIDLSEYVK